MVNSLVESQWPFFGETIAWNIMLFGRKGHFPMRMRTIMFRPALIPMTKLRSQWVKGKVFETLTDWGRSVNKSGIAFWNDMRFSWWGNLIIPGIDFASVIEMVQSIQWLGEDLGSKLFWIFLLVKNFDLVQVYVMSWKIMLCMYSPGGILRNSPRNILNIWIAR